jgi:hypothetical protein
MKLLADLRTLLALYKSPWISECGHYSALEKAVLTMELKQTFPSQDVLLSSHFRRTPLHRFKLLMNCEGMLKSETFLRRSLKLSETLL